MNRQPREQLAHKLREQPRQQLFAKLACEPFVS
jgi:hypothetical protein